MEIFVLIMKIYFKIFMIIVIVIMTLCLQNENINKFIVMLNGKRNDMKIFFTVFMIIFIK